mmetsp:Transcript_88867/g.212138  ORF Transcript_88867/g.212138 Transcript_88867/m.212138 type:complete len:265 (-) Transcript_88867:163-957(-)
MEALQVDAAHHEQQDIAEHVREGAVGELVCDRPPELKPQVLAPRPRQRQIRLPGEEGFQPHWARARRNRQHEVAQEDEHRLDQRKRRKALHDKELGVLFMHLPLQHVSEAFMLLLLLSGEVQLHLLSLCHILIVLDLGPLDGRAAPAHALQLSLGCITIVCHLRAACRRPTFATPLDHLEVCAPLGLVFSLAQHRNLLSLGSERLLVLQAPRAEPVAEEVLEALLGVASHLLQPFPAWNFSLICLVRYCCSFQPIEGGCCRRVS